MGKRMRYRCTKCRKYHFVSSGIGKKHKKYNPYKDSRIPYV